MPEFDKTNTGTLWPADLPKEDDRHADFSGTLDVGGQTYFIDAWKKVCGPNSKAPGKKFLSVRVKPKGRGRGEYQPAPSDSGDDW